VCYRQGKLNAVLNKEQLAEALYQFGLGFNHARRFDDAKAALEKSLSIRETADSLAALGYVEDALDHKEAAMDLYQRALAIEPGHFMATENLRNLRRR
jgi:tetratricopeptide (TPR) repeat protein